MQKLGGSSLIVLAVGLASPAIAQSQSDAGLEEIIVTATKRSENLQNVPVAVSAISQTALQSRGVFETSDLSHSMPNLQVSSPYGQQQPNFSLRGIGVGSEYNANAASPVGVYVDEVYQAFRSSHGQQLYDLEQVEVVRGPQGTLYGRNTTGGAINFITRKPSLKGTNGYLTLGYANYHRVNAEGALEITPVEGVLGIRIAGTYVNSDPYIHNVFPAGQVSALFKGGLDPRLSTGINPGGTKTYGFRGQLRYNPSTDLDVTLKGYAAKSKGGQEVPITTGAFKGTDLIYRPSTLLNSFLPAFATHANTGALGLPGATIADAFASVPGAAAYSNNANGYDSLNVNTDTNGRAVTRAEGGVLAVDYGLSDGLRVKSISGYDSGVYQQLENTDCDASFLRLCSIGYSSHYHAWNQDIRLDYNGDRLKLIVGGYYGHDSITSHNNPDFFNALTLFNLSAGNSPTYFNPAGIFSDGISATYGNLLNGEGLLPPMPTGVTATQNYRQIRDSWAIYGEGSYELSAQLKATMGLRYTSDKTRFKDGLTTYFNDAGQAALVTVSANEQFYYILPLYREDGSLAHAASTGPFPTGLERKGSSSRLSGRFILDYKPTEKTMLYLSYSRGYRAGTFNGLAYQRSDQVYFVPPESVNAYELGFKGRFFDNRLQLNGAFFYYDYKGQQGQVVDSTATANLIALDGTMKGLELEAELAVTDRLRLSASLGLLDSKYKHGDCSTPFTGQQHGNCVLSGAGPVDVGGNPFPFAAKQSANFGMDWTVVDEGVDKVTFHADASYTGNFHYDAFGDYSKVPLINIIPVPNPLSPGNLITQTPLVGGEFTKGGGDFWMANARMTFTHDRYSLALWMKNIFDKTTYPYGIATEFLFGNDYRVRNQPRTFGVEAKVTF